MARENVTQMTPGIYSARSLGPREARLNSHKGNTWLPLGCGVATQLAADLMHISMHSPKVKETYPGAGGP